MCNDLAENNSMEKGVSAPTQLELFFFKVYLKRGDLHSDLIYLVWEDKSFSNPLQNSEVDSKNFNEKKIVKDKFLKWSTSQIKIF